MTRHRAVRTALAAAAVALLASPAAGASSTTIDGTLVARGVWTLEGSAQGTLGVTASLYDDALSAPVAVQGAFDIVVVEATYAESAAPSALVPLTERETATLHADDLQLEVARGGGLLLVLAETDVLAGDATLAGATSMRPFLLNDFMGDARGPTRDTHDTRPRMGCGTLDQEGGIPRLTGGSRIVFMGGTLRAAGQTYTTGITSTAGPLRTVTETYAVARSSQSILDLQGAWRHCARSFGGQAQGDMSLTAVQGVVGMGDDVYDEARALFHAQGDFDVAFAYKPASTDATWTVQGEATYVALDGTARLNPTAAVAGGATLLAGLALLAWKAPALAAALVLRNGQDALLHPKRAQLVEVLRAQPGLTVSEAATQLGLSKTATRFHIRVLCRAEHVQVERHAGREHLRARHTRLAADMPMLAQLRHPVRAQIARTLGAAATPLTYSDLRRLWQDRAEPSLSHPLVLYHTRLMQANGLLVHGRRGSRVTWQLAPHVGQWLIAQHAAPRETALTETAHEAVA